MSFNDDGSVGRRSRGRVALGDGVPALRFDRRAKRIFDIVVATTGLILSSPIFLVICIAIRLDSRGPIFSREILYGYKNRAIRVHKFRSVADCAKANQVQSCVTRIGQVLCRTGIDELPRLFDVLRGEMSIVGPRPSVRRQDLLKNRLTPLLDDFKPGLTSLAQISESREEFRTTERRIKDDLYYVQNWSLVLDLRIILATLRQTTGEY